MKEGAEKNLSPRIFLLAFHYIKKRENSGDEIDGRDVSVRGKPSLLAQLKQLETKNL